MRFLKLLLAFVFVSNLCLGQYINRDGYTIWQGDMSIQKKTRPLSSALLELGKDSTNKGLILPRIMDTSVIVSPSKGMIAYVNPLKIPYLYDGIKWRPLGQSTACQGTILNSGSIVYSGNGLVFYASDLEYSIICADYSSSAATLTLPAAHSTWPYIAKFYADITGNVGIISGVPSFNPVEPRVNPLTQIDLGFVLVGAGSSVPTNIVQTKIYDEDVEWSHLTDIAGASFTATPSCNGTLSISSPDMASGKYISFQYGSFMNITNQDYLVLTYKPIGPFSVDPPNSFVISFYNGATRISEEFTVSDGAYGFDSQKIDSCQRIVIPLSGILVSDSLFDKLYITNNGAIPEFEMDNIYLLSSANVPPVSGGEYWGLRGTNISGISPMPRHGTTSADPLVFITSDSTRAIIPANGIVELSNDDLSQKLLTIKNDTIYKTNIPTAYGTLPIVVEKRDDSTFITCPTCDTTGGGGGSWLLVGNAGTTAGTNFIGTTDAQGLMFMTDNIQSGYIDINLASTSFGQYSLDDSTTGQGNSAFGYNALASNSSGNQNTAVGNDGLFLNTTGGNNTAIGNQSLLALVSGNANTAIGAFTSGATSSTDTSIAIGFQASASTKQVAFSPYVNTMFLNLDSASGTAPAIAGIDENGNWRKYATPSGGSSQWTDTTAGIYYADKVGIGVVSNPTHTLTLGDSSTSATYFQSVDESDDVFSIYSPADGGDIVHIDNNTKNILLGEIGNYKVAIGTATPDSALTVNGGTHLMGGVRASGLPTSGTYSKSLAIDASGNVYTKDTLAVSGVYALINANTTGSAATLTTPRLINGVSFNGSADISTDTYLKAIQEMGSTIVAQNIDGTLADASGAMSVASQRVYFSAVYLPVATTITGFKWKQSVTGNYTASNYNGGGLYTYSGGTLTLVASSTNDANIWKATVNTIGSKAFSSTYSAAAGLYFVAVTYSASAVVVNPSLGSLVPSSSVNIINDFTNSAKSSGFISSLTALPSPTQAMSGITATGGEIWVSLF